MSRKARKNVGVIGLGIIGTRVAAGLRAGGYQVYVWNRSAKPAPNFLGSPAEVAQSAEIIQLFVSDSAALFEVIEAMSDSLTPQHVVVCCATVGPEAVLEAAKLVEAKSAQFLDAPFTGSKTAAEKQQLVYYVGGAEATYLKVKPVLDVTSKAVVRIGEIGHAATVKVVTNMISAVTVQVLAEALSIVQKAGLEPEVLAAAIEQNACRSGVIDIKLPKMISGDFDPHFSLKHMFKDVQLGIHMANALDIEVPVTTVTAGVMYGALNKGWADLDFSALYKNYIPTAPAEEFPALLGPESRREQLPAPQESSDGLPDIESTDDADNGAAGREENNGEIAVQASSDTTDDVLPAAAAKSSGEVESKTSELEATEIPASALESAPKSISDEKSDVEKVGDEAIPKVESTDEKREQSAEGGEVKVDGAEPSNGEGEPVVRTQNFVRRWFVARSGS